MADVTQYSAQPVVETNTPNGQSGAHLHARIAGGNLHLWMISPITTIFATVPSIASVTWNKNSFDRYRAGSRDASPVAGASEDKDRNVTFSSL
jgi:hypothetical protein